MVMIIIIITIMIMIRVQHRLQKLFSERGKLPLKLTCPATPLFNKGNIGLCPKQYLTSGASQGLLQPAPLPFFAEFTCKLQRGQWLCCTLMIMIIIIMIIIIIIIEINNNKNKNIMIIIIVIFIYFYFSMSWFSVTLLEPRLTPNTSILILSTSAWRRPTSSQPPRRPSTPGSSRTPSSSPPSSSLGSARVEQKSKTLTLPMLRLL